MNPTFIVNRGLIGLALGIGFALGAAGIFLIDHFIVRRRRLAVENSHDVNRLAADVNDLREQLRQIRAAGGSKKSRSSSRNTRTTTSEAETSDAELVSAFDTTEDDEEFYDISDNEDEVEDSRLAQLLREVDHLLRGNAEDLQKAFDILDQHYDQYGDNPELLWRLAAATHQLVAALGETLSNERKKDMIQKGCTFAKKALELKPTSAEAHKWYAINVGTRGQMSGLHESIKDGDLFKKHIDEAFKLKPNDSTLHHLLGRFHFEVASLSWFKRYIAAKLSIAPSSTVDDALQFFLQAERLAAIPWKENRLFIAQCYESLQNTESTIEWLEKAEVVESVTPGDEAAEKTVQELLNKYATYRINRRRTE